MLPNRIVAIITAVLGLAAALAPVVADLDWESTAGIIAGIGVVAGVALKWLDGWQKYEERTDLEGLVKDQISAGQPPESATADGEPNAENRYTQPPGLQPKR